MPRPIALRAAALTFAACGALASPVRAQVAQLPAAAALTGGQINWGSYAVGGYDVVTGTVGGVGFTLAPTNGALNRLHRVTALDYGPGFNTGAIEPIMFYHGGPGIRFSFARGLTAFGFSGIGNWTGGYSLTLDLFAGSTLVGTLTRTGEAGGFGYRNSGPTFLGLSSTTPFDAAVLRSGGRDRYGDYDIGFAINLTGANPAPQAGLPAATVTPEPGTVALLAAGLLGVGGAARRRRVRTA